MSRETDRLRDAGLIVEARRGNMRLISANMETVIAPALTALLALTFGPAAVVAERLSNVHHVEEAFIYGSWAARYLDIPGSVPNDIDVLVVGEADDDELHQAAMEAEQTLGREVNIRRVTGDTWTNYVNDAFLSSVRSRPMIRLDLGTDLNEMGTGKSSNRRPD